MDNSIILFKNISLKPVFKGLNLDIKTGSRCLLLTRHEDENTALLQLISGLRKPDEGSLYLQGQLLADLSAEQLYTMRRTIGIIPGNGGLISNLKAWENITLPLLYNQGITTEDIKENILDRLERLGYKGNLMALPAHLSQHEKRCISFLRATIMEPAIMVYSNCHAGSPEAARRLFFSSTSEFHHRSPGRTSVFISTSKDPLDYLEFDLVARISEQTNKAGLP